MTEHTLRSPYVVAHFMYDEKENGRDWFRILFIMHEKDDEDYLHKVVFKEY